MNETVTITKKEYDDLMRDSAFLECLRACGVDNWGDYGEACEMMSEEEGEE